MNTVIVLTATLLLSVGPKADTVAQSTLHPSKFDQRFSSMPLSGNSKALGSHLGKATTALYGKRLQQTTNDPHAHDRVLAEIALKMQGIRDSHIAFKGQNTGYNVSVVNDEFAHNCGESMMVMPIEKAHDYYFFVKGRGLWKVVTTSVKRQQFPVFLLELTQTYGAAKVVEYADPDKRERPVLARWDDGLFIVEARTRPDYGAITLSWAISGISKRIAKIRGDNKPPAAGLGDGLDPAILDILED